MVGIRTESALNRWAKELLERKDEREAERRVSVFT